MAVEGKKSHSVKVPRLYKVAASILREYKNGGGSLKTLVYGDAVAAMNGDNRRNATSAKTWHPNTKGIFAILSECVKHREVLRSLFESTGLLSNEAKLDPCLAEVLCAELLWGKGSLPGNSRPVQTLLAYESDLRRGAATNDCEDKVLAKPRFARVNTLKSRMGAVCRHLKHEGLSEVIYDKASTTYEEFLELLKELKGSNSFIVDYHVPNLLVFAPGTSFYDHPLYTDGSLILQDKASCLPVTALDLPPNCSDTVLDACAAPGMKTTQLAAATSGKVFAVERDPKRAETLHSMLHSSGASERTQVLQQDFLSVDPDHFPEVTYIVVDPSCSGSGMVDRQGDSDLNEDRLHRLFVVQTKLLTHAMHFPGVKKIVYSTCSVSEEENEKVVERVLSGGMGEKFKLVSCLNTWERRGKDVIVGHEKVVRSDPSLDMCNGFFVAVFQRRKEKKSKRGQSDEAEVEVEPKKKKKTKLS